MYFVILKTFNSTFKSEEASNVCAVWCVVLAPHTQDPSNKNIAERPNAKVFAEK